MIDLNDAPILTLVREAKITAFLGPDAEERYEASGVAMRDGAYYIVFDNLPDILSFRIEADTKPSDITYYTGQSRQIGYEDIGFDAESRRWFCLVEAVNEGHGVIRPWIDELDANFKLIRGLPLDFALDEENKGMEGLAYLHLRDGSQMMVGLCEGNNCLGGKAGRKPGNGRLQLFREGKTHWDHVGEMPLPRSVAFEDYAALQVTDRRFTVISQRSSALWVGRLRDEANLDDALAGTAFAGDGELYRFPRSKKGKRHYCNLEGVAWSGPDTVVTVSDRAKRGAQPKRCHDTEQSVHEFRLPPANKKT